MAAAVEEEWETAVGTLSIGKDNNSETPPAGCSKPPTTGGAASLSPESSKSARTATVPRPLPGAATQDPANSATGTPAVAAGAAGAGQDGSVDTVLMDALGNARDYVLKLESELIAFVSTKEDPKPPHLVLPPRSSYQRLIAYRLAARFKLQKATPAQEREAIVAAGMDPATTNGVASPLPPAPPSSGGKDNSHHHHHHHHHHHQQQQRVTVFVRVADSAVPSLLMSTLDAEARKKEAVAAVATATAVAATGSKGAPIKLMRRIPGDPRLPNPQQGQGQGGPEKQVKSVEDREREYAEARARIFGTKSPPLPTSSGVVGSDGSASLSSPGGGSEPSALRDGAHAEGGVSSPNAAASAATATATATDVAGAADANAGAGAGAGAVSTAAAAGERTAEAGSASTNRAGKETAEGVRETQTGGSKGKGKPSNKGERDAAAASMSNGDNGLPPFGAVAAASAGATTPPSVGSVAKKISPSKGAGAGGKANGSAGESTGAAAGGARGGSVNSKATATTAGVGTAPGSGGGGRRTDREIKQAGGVLTSQGPDGTTGFSSGRGKPVPGGGGGKSGGRAGGLQGPDGGDRGDYSRGGDRSGSGGRGSGGGGGGGSGSGGSGGRGNRRPPVNAGEWKGQRGMQRNRMAEKSDPDFVRNYDNYRPSFAPFRQLADPVGGRGVRGGRDGLGGQQQASPRLLHQHQQQTMMGSAVQHGHGQAPQGMVTMPLAMHGQHIRRQMPGQPGVMILPQQQHQQVWQQHQHQHQQQMEAQAIATAAAAAAAAAAAGGAPPTAYGAPAPGLAIHPAQGYMDPTQAAVVAASTPPAGASAATSAGGGPTARGQQQQQHHHQSRHQQHQPHMQHHQQHPQQHPQQPAHHVQQHQMGYMHQQQPQQQPGLMPTTPQPQQGQQPQHPQQTGLLQTPHIQTNVPMVGGYMTAHDYYGAHQPAMFYPQDPSGQGMAMGYGVQPQQLPQQAQQQQQQQQQQGYVMSVPQQAQQQAQAQVQAQQQPSQQHHPYQHHVYPVGAMQQQPMPQQHGNHQHHQGGGGGRHAGRGGGAAGGGRRSVPNRGYQNEFPPLG